MDNMEDWKNVASKVEKPTLKSYSCKELNNFQVQNKQRGGYNGGICPPMQQVLQNEVDKFSSVNNYCMSY